MTFREIYESAVHLICEDPADSFDYEERSGYLLASFCTQAHGADKRYRTANGLGAAGEIPEVCADLNADFPLSPIFAPCAVFYVAALLALDENEELSDKLFARYSDGMSDILSALPCRQEPIADRYHRI